MNFTAGLLVFLVSSILLCSLTQSTQVQVFLAKDCSGGTYTAGSTYSSNLGRLLTELSANATNSNGFYKTSVGQNSDEIYGLYMCRGDINSQECALCVSTAQGNVTSNCPNQMTGIIWYDLCMLRYSNDSSILSTMQSSPFYSLWDANFTTNSSQSTQNELQLINDLVNRASNSTLMYAADAQNYTNYTKIYGLVQCTPDISQQDCLNCFTVATYGIYKGVEITRNSTVGFRLLTPSCNLRSEIYNFTDPNPSGPAPQGPQPGSSPPPPRGNGTNSSTIIIIVSVVLATIAGIILLSVIYICLRKRRKPRSDTNGPRQVSVVQSLQFSFFTIRAATFNFSDVNKLGQGGFGPVYKGKLLNGQEIAVKRLSKNSGQGEVEFKNEVELLAKLRHKNLVQLLGFSFHGKEKLLIYEFLPNTSLDHFIFDPIKRSSLDWNTCLKIIRGIARGLLYLHEECQHKIIHRDLKASNILLDKEMNPKIADFGMARLCVVDETQITNKIVGTYGYMAPEYALHGLFSDKSDVFSFGVLLLEIVSGRKNNSFNKLEHTEDLISFAWRNWKENTPLELTDITLTEDSSISEMMQCVHIGLLCVQEKAADRPTTASIDHMFNRSSITLPEPLPSALSFYSIRRPDQHSSQNDLSVTEQVTSTTKSTQWSINDTSSTELSARQVHGDGSA